MMLIKKTVPLLFVICIFATGCAGGSSGIDKENMPNEIYADTDFELSELFIDHTEVLNDFDENEFTINSEKAISDLIDALILSEKWSEEFKLICSGMVTSDQEAYYQITLNTENEFSYSVIGTFWVNANSGAIYLKFDPTLDAKGYFSEFSGDIPKDDNRTRLIAFP